MSQTEYNLHSLLTALNAINELPENKILDNKKLHSEIQSVISGSNISRLINSMSDDYRREQDAAMNQASNGKLRFDSPEFLHLYAKYRGAAYNVLSDSAFTINRLTSPVKKTESVAFNARKENPFHSNSIKELSETKQFSEAFTEAFNSIYSDRSLQINTINDPTKISSYIDYSPYTWNYIDYLSIPTLAQTIDLSIQIATRQVPNIMCDDVEMKDEIERAFKRGKFQELVQKMLLYSHLSPRGSLIVPIENDNGSIRFNVFNDTQFTYATSYQYSRIDFHENLTGVSNLYVLGHLVQNEVTGHFLCPGFEPIYAIGKNRLYQLKEAAEAVNIYLYTIKVLCIRAQVIVQTWDGGGQNDTLLAAIKKLTDNINSNLSLSTALKVPQGSTVDILNNNLSEGFAKISPIIKEFQGMLSGIMPDHFYGSDTAYAANTFNVRATNQNIRSQIQESQIEPIYRFAINKLLGMHKRFKKWSDQEDEFDIEFESLYEPTSVEKAEMDSKKIDNIIKMADYPELRNVFVAEKLLDDDIKLPERTME